MIIHEKSIIKKFKPKQIALRVTVHIVYFSQELIDELQIKTGDEVVFSQSDDGKTWYFAVIPLTSALRGTVIRKPKTYLYQTQLVKSMKDFITLGTYELSDPVNYKDIDWFELILIK